MNETTERSSAVAGRRRVLKGLALAAVGFPAIIRARDAGPTLRVLGTHVTLHEAIRKRAEADLGIRIQFQPGGSAEVLLRAATDPESFDLYEQWSDSIRVLWRAQTIQPIDTCKLALWDEVSSLSKTGRISPTALPGAGDVPNTILYVQPDGRLGATPQARISFLPYAHNVDSFGYNPARIGEGEPYVDESWGWLLAPEHAGRVALVNSPSIGVFDLALAARARGLIDFDDLGAMRSDEVEALFEIAIAYKRAGQFRAFWSSVPHSAELMLAGDTDLGSMFSPGVTQVRAGGMPCLYAAPREGYRAWHGVMCLSAAARDERADAAYRFMDWWLSGWPGAYIARQGYYISTPERARAFLDDDEWRYWYQGEPAERALPAPDGTPVVDAGATRRGGSYRERFEHIAVWNTIMPTYDLTVRRWSELVLA
ncbi:MAG: extracellular solute-binding protein [Wenzhouxiangellaceae bacterium]|nr:extracellular solute-binding protein [Wenzhouxiangellaceae bacterium]